MAKRRVMQIRNEMYAPGMMHDHGDAAYENINVQVSSALGTINKYLMGRFANHHVFLCVC